MSHKKDNSKDQKRYKPISDRFTVRLNELANPLAATAAKLNVKPGALLKMILREHLEGKGGRDHETLKSLLEELKNFKIGFTNVGRNLNQITQHMNVTDELDKQLLLTVLEEMREEFKALSKLQKAILDELRN